MFQLSVRVWRERTVRSAVRDVCPTPAADVGSSHHPFPRWLRWPQEMRNGYVRD